MNYIHVITKDDDPVATRLVILNEELAGVKFVWIHHIQVPFSTGDDDDEHESERGEEERTIQMQ